jgi:hypothetical protein
MTHLDFSFLNSSPWLPFRREWVRQQDSKEYAGRVSVNLPYIQRFCLKMWLRLHAPAA